MARNDQPNNNTNGGRPENGIPSSYAGGTGTASTPSSTPSSSSGSESQSWSQGYHGATPGTGSGKFYGSAMDRIGQGRARSSLSRDDDWRAHGAFHSGRGDEPSGTYGESPRYGEGSRYGETSTYGSSGEYPGGNFGGGTGSSYRDAREGGRSSPSFRGEEGYRESTSGRVGTRTEQMRGYRREYGDELGSAVDRYGYAGMRTDREVRSRWLKEPLYAHDVMTRSPRTVMPTTSLREAALLMRDEDTGILPVCDAGGRLLGVLTDRDMVVRAFAFDKIPGQIRVEDVMSDEVEAVTQDESVHDVLELMGSKQIRRVPVVDRDDRLIGIISMGDIARKADTDEDLQDALHRISGRRSFWNKLFR